jgi:flavin-dependent dehydrogenase
MTRTTEIAIVGAGPAGAVMALQLARLGHRVVLIAGKSSSHCHNIETLTPGVAEQLAFLGARPILDAPHTRRTSEVELRWQSDRYEPHHKAGFLIDRDAFDAELVGIAVRNGSDILAADAMSVRRHADGWRLDCHCGDGPLALSSRLLVDATGRRGVLPKRRRLRSHRLLAVHGCWRGAYVPSAIRLASSERCWAWGAPVAGEAYEATVFLDPRDLEAEGKSIELRYRALIDACGLLDRAGAAELIGPVRACDATPYVDRDAVGTDFIKIGDAALAIDPLSSSGVQTAIQSGVSGAIAVRTLMNNVGDDELVATFWTSEVTRHSRQHASWSAGFYRTAAARFGTPFWRSRSALAEPNAAPPASAEQRTLPGPAQTLRLSSSLVFADAPCVIGSKIQRRPVVTHSTSGEPLAFLGGTDLPALLRHVRPGMSAAAVLQSWTQQVDPSRAIAILSWTWEHGFIEPAAPEAVSRSREPARPCRLASFA